VGAPGREASTPPERTCGTADDGAGATAAWVTVVAKTGGAAEPIAHAGIGDGEAGQRRRLSGTPRPETGIP